MQIIISAVTLACSVVTVVILISTKMVSLWQRRTCFDVKATDFVDDSNHEVLRIFITIVNRSSAPLSIQDIHFLGDLRRKHELYMRPASWSHMYISPIDVRSKAFKKLTDDQKRFLAASTGAVLSSEDFTRAGVIETDTMPITIAAYSTFAGYLSFQSGLSSGQVNSRLMENVFLVTTSRGIFQKSFHPYSRGEN